MPPRAATRWTTALLLAAAAPTFAAGPVPVVTPRVQREAGLPAPAVWPSFSGSVGGDTVRNCLTWGMGWEGFVDRRAMPLMQKTGRVWLHNPGGMLLGKDMEFDQFTRCRQMADLTGNEVLLRVSRWDEFTRHMSRLAEAGEVVVYLGGPLSFPLREGETDEQWLERALAEIAPVTRIRPPVTIGLDVAYGQPADATQQKKHRWDRCGGPDGLHARLVRHLIDAGHEVLFEPGVLAGAEWAHGRVGVISNHRFWDKQLRLAKDFRIKHHLPGWGEYASPLDIGTRQFRYLQLLADRTREEELALIDALVEAGYDCIVPWEKHPDRTGRPEGG